MPLPFVTAFASHNVGMQFLHGYKTRKTALRFHCGLDELLKGHENLAKTTKKLNSAQSEIQDLQQVQTSWCSIKPRLLTTRPPRVPNLLAIHA